MADLSLTAAFGDYDRLGGLHSAALRPQGIDLRVLTLPPNEIFRRMCQGLEFDVSEMSMGAHCFLLGQGQSPFVGLPAFPSKAFRHAMVYVNTDSGIERPEDLNGKRIGIREWGMTAVVWIVGILAEEHGLELGSVDWVASIAPRVPLQMPAGASMRYLSDGEDLSAMLDAGELDAVLMHQVPACFRNGSPRIKRLFDDYKGAEIDYYRRTGVHPIMHCVVVHAKVQQAHPWVAANLHRALCEARANTMACLLDTGALSAMVPFLPAAMDETLALFGADFWPYGVEPNRPTLECLVRYAQEQGLTDRTLAVEELFLPGLQP